ncbi:uncharacterized protein GGS25DRAFT_485948 [Hypoxylon fragiforme]|uniref:uncharacterized protein n=1 Tax=Hypoxylon fragiforme TaxID=63214 RepID=UPI0020C6DE02|nr:uncharacterized protein GGS25DRAFT_485948 [Hypoxylon fragiforme]KAI2609721.1 hypothetical protein GGS25DRAFT_485948 [Hypoxylon fragiforme]
MVWPRRYMSWGPRSSARPSTLAPANTSWEPSQNPMKSRDNLCNQETVMPQWPSEMDSFDCIPGPSTIPTSQVTGDSIIQTPLSLGLSQLSPIDPTLTNYSAYPYPGSESPQSQQQTQIPKFYLEASGVQQMGQIYKIHGTSIPVTVTPDYHSSINESAIEALRLVDRPLPREILKHTRPTDQRRYVQFELILGGRTFPVSAMVKKGSDLSISLSHNSELANILNPALGCFLQTNLTSKSIKMHFSLCPQH